MNRMLAAIKLDVTIQVRYKLYAIGPGVAALTAIMLAWLARADQLPAIVPSILLLVLGGTTLLYMGSMILFEKEQGTLDATIVSPMRTGEYLGSKVATLTFLAALEGAVTVGGAMLVMSFFETVSLPNLPLLLGGILAVGVLYTLVGIILIVRYEKITDFLMPMAAVFVVLQLPFLYFLDLIQHPIFLVIPTSAPVTLMQAAYEPLPAWKWLYAIGYTAAALIGLGVWAYRSFQAHIIYKAG